MRKLIVLLAASFAAAQGSVAGTWKLNFQTDQGAVDADLILKQDGEMVTGSRLPRTECMSVAEREARAKAARENTDKFIRNVCTPGEGSSCGQ